MQTRESLLIEYLSAKTRDPYALAHELIHAGRKFGNVVEKENSLAASGPRVTSRVHFTIEKKMDKFTSLFVDVFAEGDSISETLGVSVSASVTSDVPEAAGLLTEIFHQSYRSHIYGKMKAGATEIAKNAFMKFKGVVEGMEV